MSVFKKATKEKSKLRLALMGPSGSGKTFTALTFASALSDKIAVIDSERGSASKYADLFSFDAVDLDSHAPQTYINMIREAEKAGYEVLIIDSLSHAWSGKDGALEQVDKAAKKSQSGNSFAAWREVTPQHNALVDAMLQSKCHVIATMRTKQEYVLEENERGRKVPRKVGMAPVQREGVEYEFDVICDLNLEHDLVVSKTRCHLVDGVVTRNPGRDFAETLKNWLDNGVAPAPKSASTASDQPVASGSQTSSAAKPNQTSQSAATSASNTSGRTADPKQSQSAAKPAGSASQAPASTAATSESAKGSSPDPKSTGTTPSADGSGTTQSAGAQGAADPKSAPTTGDSSASSQAAQSQSSATATVGKTEMQQLLQAGTANGWQKHQLTEFICHAFKLTPQTMTTDFTFKLWEQAVRILSHPQNANGVVSVSASGQPLGPEHRWPQD